MYSQSRRRHHSGPSSPLHHRPFDHDDYFDPLNNGSDSVHDSRRRSIQPEPPSAYNSFDAHARRRPGVPVDYVEYSRGRRPARQPLYSDPRASGWRDTSAAMNDSYDDLPRPKRSLRSHSLGRPRHDRDGARDFPPPSRHSKRHDGSSTSTRSKSVSSPSRREKRSEEGGSPWWQNPILRACAVTALSTGLSVALDSRGDPGQWKGAKGAKVALATVGSAVVDGFIGQKHPNGLRHKTMKKGMEMAMDEAEKKKHRDYETDEEEEHDRRSRNTRRHHSTGRGDERRHRSHGESQRRR